MNEYQNKMKFQVITILFALLLSSPIYGQETTYRKDTISLTVYFRQASSEIDRNFMSNGKALSKFTSIINELNINEKAKIDAVDITTSSSPEGRPDYNEKLSMDRARAIKNYLLNETVLTPSQIRAYSIGVDWDGFRDIIKKVEHPMRQEILGIINMPEPYTKDGNRITDLRIERLKKLDDGKVWTWLMCDIFTKLRQAGGKINCLVSFSDENVAQAYRIQRDTLVIVHKDTVYNFTTLAYHNTTDKIKAKNSRGYFKKDSLFKVPVFAFRSNLLIAPLMNIGIEVPIRNRISLEADFYSPWIKREWLDHFMPSHKGCFQIVGGSIGCRYWLGNQHRNKGGDARYNLRGHSLGLIATGGIYDVEWDWKGQQGECVFVGIDYLYAHPVGKGGVHFEFNIGVGYGINWYNNYNVRYEGGKLIDDGGRQKRQLFVPIRTGVSLVVPICKNYTANKTTKTSEGLTK